MLGLLGLFGALLASLSLDGGSDASDAGREEGSSGDETEAWQVSTAFLDDADGADHGGTEPDGQPISDDVDDPVDPDLVLSGTAGADTLAGGSGQDQISAGAGADYLDGRDGDDALWAGDGDDHAQGRGGNDVLAGGTGADSLWGDDGNDDLIGGVGDDVLAGCEGNDSLDAGDGADSAMGGGGDDWLNGGAGDDTLLGGEGNDAVMGGAGADGVEGGEGDDTLWGADEGDPDEAVDFLNGGGGEDVLQLGAGDYGHGGMGSDSFALHEFAPGTALVQITDFDPAEDQLVVMYDAQLHPDPQLTLQQGSGATILLLDGVPLASLTNGAALELGAIQLQAA